MSTLTPPLQRICLHGELTNKGYFAFDLSPRHDALSSCDSKQALGGRSQHESSSDLGSLTEGGLGFRRILGIILFLKHFWGDRIKGKEISKESSTHCGESRNRTGCKSADSIKETDDSISAAEIVNMGMNNLSP